MRNWIALATVTAVAAVSIAANGTLDQSPAAQTTPTPTSTPTNSPEPTPSEPSPTPTQIAAEPYEPFRFAVIGDSGTGDLNQLAVATGMCAWRSDNPFSLVVTAGDNVYPDGSKARFDAAFFDPYSCLLNQDVEFRAALGNHDVATNNGRPEINQEAFGIRKRNYVVRRGGVRFVIADSNNLNMDWLRQATKTKPGDRWTVVSFHHPVYSPGTGHGSEEGFRPKLPRLFDRRGVDLVVNGHDHIYSVSKPLRGIRYVVTGGAGAGLYGCAPAWFSATCKEQHHFLYVVARADSMRVRAISPQGDVIHGFKLSPNE